jgi:hypothetical protein
MLARGPRHIKPVLLYLGAVTVCFYAGYGLPPLALSTPWRILAPGAWPTERARPELAARAQRHMASPNAAQRPGVENVWGTRLVV